MGQRISAGGEFRGMVGIGSELHCKVTGTVLILKPWITPSLFDNKPDWVVDEWSYGDYSRRQKTPFTEIRVHWSNWIQKSDLETMKRVGLVSGLGGELLISEHSPDTDRLCVHIKYHMSCLLKNRLVPYPARQERTVPHRRLRLS